MPTEPDFDTEIDIAWTQFSHRLSTYVAAMSDGDSLAICTGRGIPSERDDLSMISVNASSTDLVGTLEGTLAQSFSDMDRRTLAHAGWSVGAEDPAGFRIVGGADVIAGAVVALLRDCRGIVHPTVVAASAAGAPLADVFDSSSAVESWETRNAHDRLVEQVDAALTSILGFRPIKDDNGDVPFGDRGIESYLRVCTSEPVVELSTTFAAHPLCHDGAAVAAEYAQVAPDLKFRVAEDCVIASARVDCSPLVEEHLGRALGSLLRFVEDHGAEILRRLSETSSALRTPPELRTLVELESGDELTPEDVALICHNDRDRILELLQFASAPDADMKDTVLTSLRNALRYVVLTLPRTQSVT